MKSPVPCSSLEASAWEADGKVFTKPPLQSAYMCVEISEKWLVLYGNCKLLNPYCK